MIEALATTLRCSCTTGCRFLKVIDSGHRTEAWQPKTCAAAVEDHFGTFYLWLEKDQRAVWLFIYHEFIQKS